MHWVRQTLWLAFSLVAGAGCTTLLGDFQPTSGTIEDAGPDQSTGLTASDAGEAGDAAASSDGGGSESTVDETGAMEGDSQVISVTTAREASLACGLTQQACSGSCVDDADPAHCGTCTHDCTTLPNVAIPAGCAAGACTFTTASCAAGYAHCSTNPDDGCEVNVAQPADCGGCGNACPSKAPLCARTAAATSSADSGLTVLGAGAAYECVPSCAAPTPTLCGQECVDLTSDPSNCNGCAMPCPTMPNAQATCASGACGYACDPGFHDCGGQCLDDTSPSSCGASCNACAAPTGTGAATCSGSPLTCGIACGQGFNLCPVNQCVSFQSDPANCSGCAKACPGAVNGLGTPTCSNAICGIQCNTGLQLCPDSSCDNMQADDHNCGTCGHECYGGAGSCVGGTCQPFVLARGLTSPFGVAADGKLVYFDDNATGSVSSIDPVTKTTVPLASLPSSSPWTLTTDGVNVYWVAQGASHLGGVWQVPVDASANAVQLVSRTTADVWGLTVDKTNVYYTTAFPQTGAPKYPLPVPPDLKASPPNGQVFSIAIGGGGASATVWPPFASPLDGGITSIVYNASDGLLYFVNYQGTTANPNNALVRRIKGDGTSELDMYPAGSSSMGMTASAAAAFVSQYTGTTEYLPIGGAVTAGVLRNNNGGGAWGWAIDGKYAYWVDSLSGAVWKTPADLSGSGPANVAVGVGKDIRQIATDARGIYWTSFADGTVWMVAK